MRPRLFTILSAISLALCMACVVMWVRSYYIRDIVSFGVTGGDSHVAQSILGRLHLLSNLSGGCVEGKVYYTADHLSPQAIWQAGMSGYPQHVQWRGGFVWQSYDNFIMCAVGDELGFTIRSRLVVIPYWFPAVVCGILPLFWLSQVRGRRHQENRRRRGLCLVCGYDLRGSPQRCPECGTPVAAELVR